MLNKWDDAIAPHLCLYLLGFACVILFTSFVMFEKYVGYIFLFLFLINLYFTIKVLQVKQDRNRIYNIIKSRISKKGYTKFLFKGKCDSICQLSQAIYISIRFKSINDVSFFFNDRKSKKINYIIEDEKLENILNNIDVNNLKEGQVIYEENGK